MAESSHALAVLTDALRAAVACRDPSCIDGSTAPASQRQQVAACICWWHANEGFICLGPRAGKQQTFVLMDEWLPATPPRSREDSLAELARRYA